MSARKDRPIVNYGTDPQGTWKRGVAAAAERIRKRGYRYGEKPPKRCFCFSELPPARRQAFTN